MATKAALEKRVNDLESQASAENETRHVVVTFVTSTDKPYYKNCSGYIMDELEQHCKDEDMLQSALERAFIDCTGSNPFLKTGVVFIEVLNKIASRCKYLLKKQGVEIP